MTLRITPQGTLEKPEKGKPLRLDKRPSGKDPAHLDAVKRLPCVICHAPPPSDAHHVFCGRYSQTRVPDRMTIPLCKTCHQWGPNAIHNGKATWVERNGPDHGYIAATLDAVEAMEAAR